MGTTAFKEKAGAVKRLQYLLVFLALASVFLAGFALSRWLGAPNERSSEHRILYYVDPMNPTHTSEKPGLAPCGMKMEPVYADEDGGTQTTAMGSFLPPGTVRIGPEKQQLIGVRLTQTAVTSETHTLRATGRVTADENTVYRVIAPTEGYLRGIPNAAQTGSIVQKDQLLASYYSTEPLAAQQAYLLALRTVDRRRTEPAFEEQTGLKVDTVDAQLVQAEENLRIAGFSETQIRELARTRQFIKSIELRAPVAGVVTARNLSPFSRFEKNTEFYRIVDLSRVWVLADLFDDEIRYVKPGAMARIVLPGHTVVSEGTVSDALAQVDPISRSYKVRLNVSNPDLILRPDAAVDVEFSVQLKPAITVPREALLDSGLKKVVYVDLGNGLFEPRKVETGWSFGDRVEIVGGLMPGERIVSSGNFLIDSESRMKLAASGECGPSSRDPVCRMEVSRKQAEASELKSEIGGTTYYFCSPECKKEFDKDPARFSKQEGKDPEKGAAAPANERPEALPGPMKDDRSQHSETLEPPKETSKDPVCGEEVDIGAAQSSGNTYEVDGVTYYFSAPACKQVFQMHPERFLAKPKATAPQMPGMPAEDHPPHGVDAAEGMK